jgi:hypothetical protein
VTLPPTSESGLSAAKEEVRRFAEDLYDEAGRIAYRCGCEAASPSHVRSAAEHLYRSGRGRRDGVLTAVGAALFGVGGSALFAFLLAAPPSVFGIASSMILTLGGAVLGTIGLKGR